MKRFVKNTKNSIMKFFPKLLWISKLVLAVRARTNIGMVIKKPVSVDMQSGLINKVAVTPANLTDAQGLKHVCPNQGGIILSSELLMNECFLKILKGFVIEELLKISLLPLCKPFALI